ncbi:MAG: MFS transporter [Gammaproteobacteria bacterium]|jgi:MHS family proline/betaine transporter-like MFS transporter|nr:MFS transporter [Gammaproteobacteria bacterium]
MPLHQNKSLLVGIISLGTLLEWAEYTFYGYMAVTFSGLFFPDNSPEMGILKTFGIFAVGYLMRPFGAIIFGHIGDIYGRKPALMISLFLMGAATFCIGCLPTFATWGIKASLLLLCMRMLQGIAISGEYNGAAIFLVEKTGDKYPALAGSWVSASAAAGMVFGGIAAFATSHPHAPSWAWRVPFLFGGVSCFVGLWLRSQVSESVFFRHSNQTSKNVMPLFGVLKQFKKSLILTGAIAAITGVFVYIGNIYIVVFLKQHVGIPTHHASFFAIFGEIIVAGLIPVMAYLADRTDAYRQYRLGLLLIAMGTPCIFMLCQTAHYGYIMLAMMLYGILNAIVCGPMVKILYDQFPSNLRYTGISFAWSVSAAIFSGTAPLVAQFLSTQYDWKFGPSFYVCVVALITYFIFSVLVPKSAPKLSLRLKQLTD